MNEPKEIQSSSTLFDVPIRDLDSAIVSAGLLLSADDLSSYFSRLKEAQSVTQEILMLEFSV